MWTSVISIDKSLKAELDFLVSKLSKIKNLSFAVEESDDRTFVHIAALCDYADAVSREINAILVELYLCRMKLSYFLKRLRYKSFGYALAALVSSLTHFDREFEEAVILRSLAEVAEYSVDGIFNFRLKRLHQNWEELAELSNNLIAVADNDEDIYNVSSFVTGTRREKLVLTLLTNNGKAVLKNAYADELIDIDAVFPDEHHNLIFTLIKERPDEIELAAKIPDELINCLRHIAKISV